MIQDIKELIDIIDSEQMRVKVWLNENCFHHGTAPFVFAKKYRDDLKQYLRLIMDDLREEDYDSYRELEEKFTEYKNKIGG